MDVTGMTAEHITELINGSIVNGVINEAGQLIFTRGNGSQVNAGSVIQAYRSFPVGSVYHSTLNENPSITLGGGTWERIASGRMLVGHSPGGDPDFDTIGDTGGNKMHTNTLLEMHAHNHGGITGDDSPDHKHQQVFDAAYNPAVGGAAPDYGMTGDPGDPALYAGPVTTMGADVRHQHGISQQGASQPWNIMNPFYVVGIWRRTA